MSNIRIALASRINFNEAVWSGSSIDLINEVTVESDLLHNLASELSARHNCPFEAFLDRVVFPYGDKLDLYLRQEMRNTLHQLRPELGKLVFAFCPAAHATILQYTGYDAPRHSVEPDDEGFAVVSPEGQHLAVILAASQDSHTAARELANKICTFLDTQP